MRVRSHHKGYADRRWVTITMWHPFSDGSRGIFSGLLSSAIVFAVVALVLSARQFDN